MRTCWRYILLVDLELTLKLVSNKEIPLLSCFDGSWSLIRLKSHWSSHWKKYASVGGIYCWSIWSWHMSQCQKSRYHCWGFVMALDPWNDSKAIDRRTGKVYICWSYKMKSVGCWDLRECQKAGSTLGVSWSLLIPDRTQKPLIPIQVYVYKDINSLVSNLSLEVFFYFITENWTLIWVLFSINRTKLMKENL